MGLSVGGRSGPIEGPGQPQRGSTAITYSQSTLPDELSSSKKMLPPQGELPPELEAKAQALALSGCHL